MSENKAIMNTISPDEIEARINALNQLLANSVPDVVKAFEGGGTLSEYEQLRDKREAWKSELDELTAGEAETRKNRQVEGVGGAMPDIVTATINNAEIIGQLTGVIVQQAGLINQLHGVVGQLGAVTSLDEEITKLQKDTDMLVGDMQAALDGKRITSF